MYCTRAGIMRGGFLAVSGRAAAQSQQQSLTLETATRIADAAQAEAARNKWNVVIAVVDDGGHAILLQRLDGAQWSSIDTAVGKASAAVAWKRPTRLLGGVRV